ncbi:MAG: DUF3427 domain-containing protein [Roseovarius sp.]|nr:DUF3427 domain-containing protein [Roseovarius sp.]
MAEFYLKDGNSGFCEICAEINSRQCRFESQIAVIKRQRDIILAPVRCVARWRDLSDFERAKLSAMIGPAQDEFGNDAIPEVMFSEDGPHMHLRIVNPRRQYHDLPHENPLISGGADALYGHLLPYIENAQSIDIAVSFIRATGARLIFPRLKEMLDRGGKIRLLTSDYLNVTEPSALRWLLDLEGELRPFVFKCGDTPFHPKAWIFDFHDGTGALLVGSSNFSKSALEKSIEWNLRLYDRNDAVALSNARNSFDELLSRPEITELTEEWLKDYEKRRTHIMYNPATMPNEGEHPPSPHHVQRQALKALNETRTNGYQAGLAVLATGLGKTYLAAFDSVQFENVLFIAHRDEILNQAELCFRAIRPNEVMGKYTGEIKNPNANIIFASIQTLSRKNHLENFTPDRFDYIVVDEFHHAAAATYKRVMEYFTPRFLLGLTATPDRTDGASLLALCEENLVFECDLWKGIDEKLLSPFHYFGVPDLVEYTQIPWRNGRFDEKELGNAVATRVRAENALEQLKKRGGSKTLGFCVSVSHADFMAGFARRQGFRAVAVHSGSKSAPRAASLMKLEDGLLDIVFAVDMFNEGVDVPSIDTVLMLRPTESIVVWLQQLGRGLRRIESKKHLSVIDYIGNHRVFLAKARALLRAGTGSGSLLKALNSCRDGSIQMPEGCEITYDLEAMEILKSLIHVPRADTEMDAFYLDFRERHGRRPTASEMHHAQFAPSGKGQDCWFDYVSDMGDLDEARRAQYRSCRTLLVKIESMPNDGIIDILALRAISEGHDFHGKMDVNDVAARIARYSRRNAMLGKLLGGDNGNVGKIRKRLLKFTIPARINQEWYHFEGETVYAKYLDASRNDGTIGKMVLELVEYRLAQAVANAKGDGKPSPQTPDLSGRPKLWNEYRREEIPRFFGETFNRGKWNQGIVVMHDAKAMILLVTLEKSGLAVGSHYKDYFETPEEFIWQSQTSTKKGDLHGRIISGFEKGWNVHMFVRGSKLRRKRAAPFRYIGIVEFKDWKGERPITVTWRLQEPLPIRIYDVLGINAT